MKTERELAAGWLRKGDSDLADPRRTVASEGPYDTACFHAQQAVEKYLKAVLAIHRRSIPRTHDLEELLRMCCELVAAPELASLDLAGLTGYAVELRYDADFWPEQPTAAEALALAEEVRALVSTVLGDKNPQRPA